MGVVVRSVLGNRSRRPDDELWRCPVDMLVKHMAERGLTTGDGDALLFTAPDGGVLRYSNWLRRVWWPAAVAAGLGRMVEDKATGRTTYEGLGFHDLRRANATGLVAAGVDVKTAQGLLGHSDSRLTLDHYAQVVTELGALAAEAMGERFLKTNTRDNRAMEGDPGANGARPCTRREGL